MADQTLVEQLAALSPEERAAVEIAAAQSDSAAKVKAEEFLHFDARQDGVLSDPRDLGPVGGSHVEG